MYSIYNFDIYCSALVLIWRLIYNKQLTQLPHRPWTNTCNDMPWTPALAETQCGQKTNMSYMDTNSHGRVWHVNTSPCWTQVTRAPLVLSGDRSLSPEMNPHITFLVGLLSQIYCPNTGYDTARCSHNWWALVFTGGPAVYTSRATNEFVGLRQLACLSLRMQICHRNMHILGIHVPFTF